jgi:hypothetical protein
MYMAQCLFLNISTFQQELKIKERVDLFLCLINYALRHEDVFLTLALDRDEWSASCRFTSGTHWLEFQVGPRGGLDAVE